MQLDNNVVHAQSRDVQENVVFAPMSGNDIRARDFVHLANVQPSCLEALVHQQPLQATPPRSPRRTKARPPRRTVSQLLPTRTNIAASKLPPTPPSCVSNHPPPPFRARRLRLKQRNKENSGCATSKFVPHSPAPSRDLDWLDAARLSCVPKHPVSVLPRAKSAPTLRRNEA